MEIKGLKSRLGEDIDDLDFEKLSSPPLLNRFVSSSSGQAPIDESNVPQSSSRHNSADEYVPYHPRMEIHELTSSLSKGYIEITYDPHEIDLELPSFPLNPFLPPTTVRSTITSRWIRANTPLRA
jgi:hypothetical protein